MGLFANIGKKNDDGEVVGFSEKAGSGDLERIVPGNYDLIIRCVKYRQSEVKKTRSHFIVEAQVEDCSGVSTKNWKGEEQGGPCIRKGQVIQWMVNFNTADEDIMAYGLNDVGNFCLALDEDLTPDKIDEAFIEAITAPATDKNGDPVEGGNPAAGTKVKARAYPVGKSEFTKVRWTAVPQ
jgi:hypothetical protein